MKNVIVITGGAGFVGSNLIKLFLKKTKYRIISIDNYSTGSKKNHIKDKRVNYIIGDTKKFLIFLKNIKNVLILFFILVNLQEYIKAF
jgi:UDP-glucose 4-epimerase